MDCRDLNVSQNSVGLDNDAKNSRSMFIASLTLNRDEGRGMVIMELRTNDVVNGLRREEGISFAINIELIHYN